MLDRLRSVTNEHTMVVQKSHARHNPLAAFLGSISGVLEHLLKFTVNFGDALLFTLQFFFEGAVRSLGMPVHVPPFEGQGRRNNLSAYVPCPPTFEAWRGKAIMLVSLPPHLGRTYLMLIGCRL